MSKEKLIFTKEEGLNNNLLTFVSDIVDIDYGKYHMITEEHLKATDDFDVFYFPQDFISLVGYQVKIKVDGDHRTDGQMVDYTFYFKSPEGKVTRIDTEMCLMIGWNYWEDIEIK